jgi:hypothetical protein
MRIRPAIFLLPLLAATLRAADPPLNPLELLNRPREAAPLSPSSPLTDRLPAVVEKALQYLDKWQSPNGAWNRLHEDDQILQNDTDLQWRLNDGPLMRGKEYRDGPVKDIPEVKENENVADTALSARAMLQAVRNGLHPEYAPKIKKSIDFLCNQIDKWNGGAKVKTILIQNRFLDPIHDKTPALGEARYYDSTIDTFFTLSFLAFARDSLTDEALKQRVDRALKILVFKIESTQDKNGVWIDETDPLAKINDFDTDPGVDIAPRLDKESAKKLRNPWGVPRTSPENMALPEGPLWRALNYDGSRKVEDHGAKFRETKNIVAHAQQIRDISLAARLGVEFKPATRYQAEACLLRFFDKGFWGPIEEGPYVRTVSPKAVILTCALAAFYQADLTARYLADQARKQNADANSLAPLDQHAKQARTTLERFTRLYIKYDTLSVTGPTLENLEDCLCAVDLLDPAAAANLRKRLRPILVSRQRTPGNFIAGPNDDWRYYEWIGSDRGEPVFGTATTLPLLLYLEKFNQDGTSKSLGH